MFRGIRPPEPAQASSARRARVASVWALDGWEALGWRSGTGCRRRRRPPCPSAPRGGCDGP
eukprot:12643681-Alexandrium_andersonii.AAC.1